MKFNRIVLDYEWVYALALGWGHLSRCRRCNATPKPLVIANTASDQPWARCTTTCRAQQAHPNGTRSSLAFSLLDEDGKLFLVCACQIHRISN